LRVQGLGCLLLLLLLGLRGQRALQLRHHLLEHHLFGGGLVFKAHRRVYHSTFKAHLCITQHLRLIDLCITHLGLDHAGLLPVELDPCHAREGVRLVGGVRDFGPRELLEREHLLPLVARQDHLEGLGFRVL